MHMARKNQGSLEEQHHGNDVTSCSVVLSVKHGNTNSRDVPKGRFPNLLLFLPFTFYLIKNKEVPSAKAVGLFT